MSQLPDLGGWADLPFFSDVWPRIDATLRAEPRDILPPDNARFAALRLTPPDKVRAVILGQDPYPTPGHANGLAFSVTEDVRPLPRSLGNIFKELQSDIGAAPENGDLSHWARQGVLLLNTALSVPAGEPNGHAKLGWQELVHQVLARVSRRATAFVLWGKSAQAQGRYITPPAQGAHLVLQSPHPSPLSARRGFFGSRPFSQINTWLAQQGAGEINWT